MKTKSASIELRLCDLIQEVISSTPELICEAGTDIPPVCSFTLNSISSMRFFKSESISWTV